MPASGQQVGSSPFYGPVPRGGWIFEVSQKQKKKSLSAVPSPTASMLKWLALHRYFFSSNIQTIVNPEKAACKVNTLPFWYLSGPFTDISTFNKVDSKLSGNVTV